MFLETRLYWAMSLRLDVAPVFWGGCRMWCPLVVGWEWGEEAKYYWPGVLDGQGYTATWEPWYIGPGTSLNGTHFFEAIKQYKTGCWFQDFLLSPQIILAQGNYPNLKEQYFALYCLRLFGNSLHGHRVTIVSSNAKLAARNTQEGNDKWAAPVSEAWTLTFFCWPSGNVRRMRSSEAWWLRASPTFVPTKEVLQCSHIRANYLDRLAKKDGDLVGSVAYMSFLLLPCLHFLAFPAWISWEQRLCYLEKRSCT